MRKRQRRKPHVTQRHKARSVGNAISIAPVPGSRSHRREVIGAGDLGAFQRFFQEGSPQMLLPQSCRLPGQRCGQHRCLRSAVVSTAACTNSMRTELRRIATERCAMTPARHCETERFAGLSSWTPPGSPRGVREADTGAQGHMSKDRTDRSLSDAYEEAPNAEACT